MRDRLCDGHKCLTRWVIFAICLLITGLVYTWVAHAHEHQPGETAEEKRTVDWLRTWHRPKGVFSIEHRVQGCCYAEGVLQDCFVVKETRVRNGVREVLPDSEGKTPPDVWYRVDTKVDEDLQPDPRESPDGRSYVCISGGQVICYVGGGGA